MRILLLILTFLPFFAFSSAQPIDGQPHPWQLNFQNSGSPVMDYIHDFHNLMLIVMFGIAIFVSVLIIYTAARFRKEKNPVPSKTTHNVMLEIIWTTIPIIIVIGLAFPSLKLLKYEEYIPDSEITIKVVGHQWYWSYSYPDHENISFDSNMKHELKPGEPRLLAVDNPLVLPIDTNVRVLVTSDDVIHSWAVPSLGVKKDGIPGRINETWLNIKREGMYYGQCSELCGILHGFMPIGIKAVSKEDFDQWLKKAKQEF